MSTDSPFGVGLTPDDGGRETTIAEMELMADTRLGAIGIPIHHSA